jgi:hypothetical protein
MKKEKIIFWAVTILIFLMQGVMPILTPQAESARTGALHLGYPEYFGNVLKVFKIFGVLALVIPQVPRRVKEWAYAGFAFDFIFAFISHYVVDGLSFQLIFPLIFMTILIVSYIYYHKMNTINLKK